MTGPVGIIANPRSGMDVRRLLASAGRSTLEDKVSIVRRVVLGAVDAGADEVLFLPEPHQLARRATETLRLDASLRLLDVPVRFDARDTEAAAAALRDAGCAVVVVLGGDGTNRAVVNAWPDAPVIPLSTGTNNSFPFHVEPTAAGTAAGLLASGRVDLDLPRSKVVRVELEGENDDLALVDAVVVDDPYAGSLELFDPETMRLAVVARAEADAIGFSGVAARCDTLGPDDDAGLLVRFASPSRPGAARCVRAPTAPGHLATVAIAEHRRLALGETVAWEGGGILAADGERQRRLPDGEVRLRVERDGPRVVDVAAVVAAGVRAGAFDVPG